MKINDLYQFQDIQRYKGWVFFNELSISLLEEKVKEIRAAFDIISKNTVVTKINELPDMTHLKGKSNYKCYLDGAEKKTR